MKHLLAGLLALMVSFSMSAQNIGSLSDDGERHYKAAKALLEVSSSLGDLKSVIEELEKVIVTDPNFADAYFDLGKLCSKVGKEEGDEYFDKARDYYYKYLSFRPEEKKDVEDELYIVETLRNSTKAYRLKKDMKKFVGTWRIVEYAWWYIFRIEEAGESLAVRVFTGEERELDTYDVRFNGTTLSFTVKDVYSWPSKHEVTIGGKTVVCDKEVDFDHWQLSLDEEKMTAKNNLEYVFYLNGRQVHTETGEYTRTYAKDK